MGSLIQLYQCTDCKTLILEDIYNSEYDMCEGCALDVQEREEEEFYNDIPF